MGRSTEKERMEVSMTYCNIETEEIRYFKFVYEMSDLEEWFDSLLQEYRKWSDADIAWKKLRQDSIHSLSFSVPVSGGTKGAGHACLSYYLPQQKTVYRSTDRGG